MKERIKELRKTLGLTQQALADRLGVKRNTVGQWECGINPLTPQTVTSICREFNVNESWLRYGEGEMFAECTRDEQIASFINAIQGVDDSFKQRFISLLVSLDTSQWALLADIARKLVENDA